MGQVLVRNLDDAVIRALKQRAKSRGISLEAELRDVLTEAATHSRADLAREFAAIRAMTPENRGLPAEDLVRESRDER